MGIGMGDGGFYGRMMDGWIDGWMGSDVTYHVGSRRL